MKKERYPGIVIHSIQSQMDEVLRRLHSDALCSRAGQAECRWYPQVDIYETPDSIIVLAECAGVGKDDLEVAIEDKILTLEGNRKDPLAGMSRIKAHNMEITYGPFKRTITIDIPIDKNQIGASYENGFLTLTIPKKKVAPTVISIQEGTSAALGEPGETENEPDP